MKVSVFDIHNTADKRTMRSNGSRAAEKDRHLRQQECEPSTDLADDLIVQIQRERIKQILKNKK